MLNLVLPLAGPAARGSLPRLLAAARPGRPHRVTFVLRDGDDALAADVRRVLPDATVLTGAARGAGTAGAVLYARERFDTADPLVVILADRLSDGAVKKAVAEMDRDHLDGVLVPTPLTTGLGIDADGLIATLDESAVAAVAFRRGCDFVRAACAVLAAGDRRAESFSVAAVVTRLIGAKATVGVTYPNVMKAAA